MEEIPDNHCSMRSILELLNLDEMNYYLAFDLKLPNINFGISSHSRTHACLWCESSLKTEAGKPKTSKSRDDNYAAYVEKAQLFSINTLSPNTSSLISHKLTVC